MRAPRERLLTPDEAEATAKEQRRKIEEMVARPLIWSDGYVLQRLVEAEQIAMRRPDSVGPRQPRTGWPSHTYSKEEVEEMRKVSIREAGPSRGERPTADEILRQEQALGWKRYIAEDSNLLHAVTCSSHWLALGLDEGERVVEEWHDGDWESFYRAKWDGLRKIARALNREKVPIL